MAARPMNERVEILEHKVELLQALPARITGLETQILQLRDEMRTGFSAIRDETRRSTADVLTRIREGDEQTLNQMRVLHEDVVARLSLLQEGRRGKKR